MLLLHLTYEVLKIGLFFRDNMIYKKRHPKYDRVSFLFGKILYLYEINK